MRTLERFSFNRPAPHGINEAVVGSAAERRDIYDRWLAFVRSSLHAYSLSSGTRKDREFQVNAHSRATGGFVLARVTTVKGSSQLDRRSAEIGTDSRDGYVMYLSLRGEIELQQFGRKHRLAPSSSSLVSSADPLVHTKLGDNDTLCLRMPREFVDQRALSAEGRCVRPVRSSGFAKLFNHTVLTLDREAASLTEEEFSVAIRLVGELALLVTGSSADISSSESSVRTCNLARVKRFMRARLTDPELTLTAVANGCGISLRYLHDLFREEAQSPREYLMSERLQHARHLLESATDCRTTVTSVSLACGFGSSSQFSTVFRRAFGISPRDLLRHR